MHSLRRDGRIHGIVANLPMFRQVPRAALAALIGQAHARELRRGEVSSQPGERLPGLFAVVYGLIKLSLRSERGEERILRLVGPGDTFGEALLFLERPAPVQAVALTDTLLAIIPAEPLLRLIDTDRQFTRAMLASMSQRLNALVADFEALTLHGARERVAAYLGSLAEPGSGPVAVLLPAPKNVIASRLGITKETLSRVLRELAQQGLIAVKRREITLLDRTALTAAAHARPVGGE